MVYKLHTSANSNKGIFLIEYCINNFSISNLIFDILSFLKRSVPPGIIIKLTFLEFLFSVKLIFLFGRRIKSIFFY